LHIIARESASQQPATEVMLRRLTELLFHSSDPAVDCPGGHKRPLDGLERCMTSPSAQRWA